MGRSSQRKSARDVLRYTRTAPAQATVRRHYIRWRQEQTPPLPERCDNPECFFHTNPLVWNGRPLKPILDHRDGNNSDNRPSMLRLLCPNCDSQQPTRGGANRGRTLKSDAGFARVSKDGRRDYVLFPETDDPPTETRATTAGPAHGPAGNLAAAQARAQQIDLADLTFDNNVIVGDGVIALEGQTWRVPSE